MVFPRSIVAPSMAAAGLLYVLPARADKPEDAQPPWWSATELEAGPSVHVFGPLPYPVHFGARVMLTHRFHQYFSAGAGFSKYVAPEKVVFDAPVSGSYEKMELRLCAHISIALFCGIWGVATLGVISADNFSRSGWPSGGFYTAQMGGGVTWRPSPWFGIRPMAELGVITSPIGIIVDAQGASQTWKPFPVFGVTTVNFVFTLPTWVKQGEVVK